MLAEGMADQASPPELAIADFKMLFPASPVVRLDGVGHFCQEDAPEALVAMIQLFIQMT
jgi:haloalkane dehalogenase